MKKLSILCLLAAIALPQLTLGENGIQLEAKTIAQIESTLDFCARVDVPSAAKYQQDSKLLVGNIFDKDRDKDLAKVRKRDEYKDTYHSISASLAKLPRDQATATCASFVQGQ